MQTILESDRVYLSGDSANITQAADSSSVTFSKIYNNPVVVSHIATNNGGQSVDSAVTNLTGSGCDIYNIEPDHQGHSDNTVTYFVAEEGVHEVEEGHRIEAGTHTTDSHSWTGSTGGNNVVEFVNNWSSPPVVIANPNTHNNQEFSTVIIKSVTSNSFEIELQHNHSEAVEDIGWIAFPDTGAINLDGVPFESARVSNSTHTFTQSFSSAPDYVVDWNEWYGASEWVRGSGTWNSTSIDWYLENGSEDASEIYAVAAIVPSSVIKGFYAVGDRSGTFEMRAPNTSYSFGGFDGLDGTNTPKGSGGTYSGVRETVGTVYETPNVEPTSTGELVGTAATSTTVTAATASSIAAQSTGAVATMQNAVVNTENTITTTETGLGGTTAKVDVVLDGALTFTQTGTGSGHTTSVGGVSTSLISVKDSIPDTSALSGGIVEVSSTNTFGNATTGTSSGGTQTTSTDSVTAPTYTASTGGSITGTQSTPQTATGYTETTPKANPTIVEANLQQASVGSSSFGGHIETTSTQPIISGTSTSVFGGSLSTSVSGNSSTANPTTSTDGFSGVTYSESLVKESRSSLRVTSSISNAVLDSLSSNGYSYVTSGGVESTSMHPYSGSVYSSSLSRASSSSFSSKSKAVTTSITAQSSTVSSIASILKAASTSFAISGGVSNLQAETLRASSKIEVLGAPTTSQFSTDTATATATTTGGEVQSASSQSLSINPEAAAGAVVVSDGMLAFPKLAITSSSDTKSSGAIVEITPAVKSSGKSFASPSVENPLTSVDTNVGIGSGVIFYSGNTSQASFDGKTATATATAEIKTGSVTVTDTASNTSKVATETYSDSMRSNIENIPQVGSVNTSSVVLSNTATSELVTANSSSTSNSVAGGKATIQIEEISTRSKIVAACSIARTEIKTKQATGTAKGSGGYLSYISSNIKGNSSSVSQSEISPTLTSAIPENGGGKALATDGGSVIAETSTNSSRGTSQSSGGKVTASIGVDSPSVGVTTSTSKNSKTVASASNFGADAMTASVSISSKDSILSSPRVPFNSKATVTAKAHTSSLVSLGKYIEPKTASKANAALTVISSIILPASIFTATQSMSFVGESTFTGVESTAFTETFGQGYTSAIAWTLKSPATSASSGAGNVQTISTMTFSGVGDTSSVGGRSVTLLSEILEANGPTIDTPGLIPRVSTDTENFVKSTSVVIDDVTSKFMNEIPRKQNDTTPLTGELVENESPVDLSQATKVEFFMTKDVGEVPVVSEVAEIVNESTGVVRYHFTPGEVSQSGIFLAEWQVTFADSTIQTFPNTGYMRVKIDEDLS